MQAPESVVAADGWIVTLDNRSGVASLVVHNLSTLEAEALVIDGLSVDMNVSYHLQDHYLGVLTSSNISVYNLEDNGTMVLFKETTGAQRINIIEYESSYALLYMQNKTIRGVSFDQTEVTGTFSQHADIKLFEPNGFEVAYVSEQTPMVVSISKIGFGEESHHLINATASIDEDDLLESWGTPVDMLNASITDIAFDSEFIAVTVNVSATDRLVMFHRETGEQWLLSNPKYQAAQPSIGHGKMAWLAKDHLNPINPQEKYMDYELYFLDFEVNRTYLLTVDSLDQQSPQVLEEHIVYVEIDDDGISTVRIHSWEPTLQTYSSVVLQLGIVMGFFVSFIHIMQRQKERRFT